MPVYDVIIVGGGASGFFCAANLLHRNPNLKILILERSPKVLNKVRISGGGRCNVTHAVDSIQDLINAYPRGGKKLRKLFNRFDTRSTVKWFEERGVKIKTESDGRMFPITDSSETIIKTLLKATTRAEIKVKQKAEALEYINEQWQVKCGDSQYRSKAVFFAPGGLSKSDQYKFIDNLNFKIVPPVPSLFTFNSPASGFKNLMGVSVKEGAVKLAGSKLEASGPVLITHWGFSGPAPLKLSSLGAREIHSKNYKGDLLINWTPFFDEKIFSEKFNQSIEEQRNKLSKNYKFADIPVRLMEKLLEISQIEESRPLTEWSKKQKTNCLKTCSDVWCIFQVKPRLKKSLLLQEEYHCRILI
ncbi:aminoacetone oxidase family FAD-binding enzyme [Mangrovivirga cuniculi]|nr:aminoacetone oxidase family FAD-binding enzyme [Mangrovivirga cuniculi]